MQRTWGQGRLIISEVDFNNMHQYMSSHVTSKLANWLVSIRKTTTIPITISIILLNNGCLSSRKEARYDKQTSKYINSSDLISICLFRNRHAMHINEQITRTFQVYQTIFESHRRPWDKGMRSQISAIVYLWYFVNFTDNV